MADRIQCWKFFSCREENCPVYVTRETKCWLVSGTRCRDRIQGRFLEKMEMCLDCPIFDRNLDPTTLRETMGLMNRQFKEMTQILRARDRELEETNLDLAVGLSQCFETVQKLCLGDPSVRLELGTHNPLLLKLETELNRLAASQQEMVEDVHEMAMGLCQHYDTLNQIACGNFTVKASEQSPNELIAKLGALINKEARTLTGLITEYQRTKNELQEKEERYRLLFEQSPLGVFHFDRTLKLTECNDRFVRLLQSSRYRLINLDLTALQDSRVLPAIQMVLAGKTGHYEGGYRGLHQPGPGLDLHAHRPAVRSGRAGDRGVGIVEDISERKKAEDTLRESENRYRTIFENTGAATLIINEDTTIELANAEFERISGYRKDELEGIASWTTVVADEDLKRMVQYHKLRREKPAAVPRDYEFKLIDRQGQGKIMHNRVALIPALPKANPR